MSTRRRIAVVVSVSLVALIVAAVAFAAWTANGTGSGQAQAKSAQALTINTVTATADLYPTGTANLQYTVTNPNPYKVNIALIEPNGAITVDAGHSGCNVVSVTLTAASYVQNFDVLGGATSANQTLTGAVVMSNAANDSCQGATFTIPLKVTGASAV
ncbi:MAG: hypothetical protein MUP97_00255 [Acidimicrobiia bacterium]|jgi:hypothetical protein|nr:hypothetical protein [Acidimicrobiia bacterium]